MKQTMIRLLALLLSGGALLSSPGAFALEHRTINGYHVQVTWPSAEYTDEDHGTYPFLIITNQKGKPVRQAELNDRRKTDVHVKVHYYGPEDRAENYWATPLETVDIGRFQEAFYDGYLYGIPVRMSTPGAYGIQLTGILNGRYFDELFVCGKGSQDPEHPVGPDGGTVPCTIDPVAFPGLLVDAYKQSAKSSN